MQTSATIQGITASPVSELRFERVLATTDFSPASRSAFETAKALAKLFGANLCVLHVFEYAAHISTPDGARFVEVGGLLEDARNGLKELKLEAEQFGVRCETAIRDGVPSIVIEEFVAENQIDVTIMGTSALHGFERLIFGSTAEAVLRKSPSPVVTVGPCVHTSAGLEEVRPVVFATDFHPTTIHAIRLAATIAEATGSPLHCLHVLPRALEGVGQAAVIPAILAEALQHVAVTSGIHVGEPVCATTYGSEISNAVVEYAKQHQAQLIVLGIRQASLATTHTPAHIAYRIITEASCPVMTMAFESHSRHFSGLAAACL